MNDSTTIEKKKQVLDKCWTLFYIVKDLEAAGIEIINAQVGDRCYVLIHCRGDHAEFRRWANSQGLEITVEPAVITDPDYGLHWKIGTNVCGFEVHGWMTDQNKEEYDATV